MSRVVECVIEQHAEEAALCWLRRDRAVAEPHYSLDDLAHLDDRLDAHLDGLRIAGDVGWAECETQLRWREPGEVFIAAALAIETRDRRRIESVLERTGENRGLWRAIASALGWHALDVAQPFIGSLVHDSDARRRGLGIAAAAIHRDDPGEAIGAALADEDDRVRARAARAAGELGRTDLLGVLRGRMASEDRSCGFWAAWSVGLLAGDGTALEAIQATIETASQESGHALQLALRRMEVARAKDWLRWMVGKAGMARSVVIGAGVLGDPDLVPWLIERMESPELARVAGEAFAMITGVHIAYQDLDGPWPEGFVAGPTEDPADENVAMDPDENLPWPDPQKIAAWWANHREQFEQGTRYLVGKPLDEEWLEHVLRNGYQRQRAAAALELAIRKPGRLLFEVRAPSFRQQQVLGLK